MPIALAVALFLGGGGVSLAAQGSLPGDILYPVKVGINERARVAFAFSDEAKARVQAQLAERRLEEAEALAAEGRFDAEARAEVESRFESHAEAVEEKVENMQENKNYVAAAEVSADFASSIEAHGVVLERLLAVNTAAEARVNKAGLAAEAQNRAEVVTASPVRREPINSERDEKKRMIEAEASTAASMSAEQTQSVKLTGEASEGGRVGGVEASGRALVVIEAPLLGERAAEASIEGQVVSSAEAPLPVGGLVQSVRTEVRDWTDAEAAIQAKASMQAELEARVTARFEATEKKLQDLRDFVAKRSEKLSANVKAEAAARLGKIASLIAEAKVKILAKDYSNALLKLSEANSIMIQTRVYISTSERLNIEIEFNGGAALRLAPQQKPREASFKASADVEAKADAKPASPSINATIPTGEELRMQIENNKVKIRVPSIDLRSSLQPVTKPTVDVAADVSANSQTSLNKIDAEASLNTKVQFGL